MNVSSSLFSKTCRPWPLAWYFYFFFFWDRSDFTEITKYQIHFQEFSIQWIHFLEFCFLFFKWGFWLTDSPPFFNFNCQLNPFFFVVVVFFVFCFWKLNELKFHFFFFFFFVIIYQTARSPVAYGLEESVTVKKQQRLILRCRTRGNPVPGVVWYKDGKPLNAASKRVRIKTKRWGHFLVCQLSSISPLKN